MKILIDPLPDCFTYFCSAEEDDNDSLYSFTLSPEDFDEEKIMSMMCSRSDNTRIQYVVRGKKLIYAFVWYPDFEKALKGFDMAGCSYLYIQ